ncbi:hypothetical protein C7S18_10460 [Ahniella affigens]|uniref:Uncharacterized protein n=1 Tax=Ahniella affigens TaxID=2021234 RepID=A0A2P1PRX1_9GAMM|nr:hypothetical protein C7S18_10460 [Ahniella affigens]
MAVWLSWFEFDPKDEFGVGLECAEAANSSFPVPAQSVGLVPARQSVGKHVGARAESEAM